MESKIEAETRIDVSGGKEWKKLETFLGEFNLSKEESTMHYEQFREICAILFDSKEISECESKIYDTFNLFDVDNDGILKSQEWTAFVNWMKTIIEPVNVLLIVDVQNDFIDGSLAIRGCSAGQDGVDVVNPINRLIKEGRFNKIIYSLDWHPDNHISFYANLHMRELHPESKILKENAKPFDSVLFSESRLEQKLWPKHCVMNTWGAELHKDLIIAPDSEQVRKGQNPEIEAYSAFFDKNSEGSVELQNILHRIHATHLFICGIAYDVCVKNTCLDGLKLGYTLSVIDDCCRGIDLHNIENTKREILENGGFVVNSDQVLSLVNEGKRSLIMSHRSAKTMTSFSSERRSVESSDAICDMVNCSEKVTN